MAINGNYTVISTFAGCGGSSLGYEWAGYKELLAIDFDNNAVETFKLNFTSPIWNKDIKECSGQEILDFCNIKSGDLDILDGSPPCQGFSTAGKRNLKDSRNDLFLEFIRLIDELQPKVFIMENVSGMAKGKYKGKFNEILQSLKDTGYAVKVKLMNAMWYEVPQSRERLFFIGVRKDIGLEPVFPKPMDKIITVGMAFNNVKNKTYARKLAKVGSIVWDNISPGQNGSAYKKNNYFNTTKISFDKPCPTICKSLNGVGGMFHPLEKRTITIEEIKRICSFPDEFNLIGNYTEQLSRLGNAVMPKMMFHIAKTIKTEILDKFYEKKAE